ncbi:hypothetical protein K438DRAFT_240723 [Mycena galopus ATCC 62051]|nr:hypothetical protein K438DRAFT_240723 [Mycena galopus ATCC 62051]
MWSRKSTKDLVDNAEERGSGVVSAVTIPNLQQMRHETRAHSCTKPVRMYRTQPVQHKRRCYGPLGCFGWLGEIPRLPERLLCVMPPVTILPSQIQSPSLISYSTPWASRRAGLVFPTEFPDFQEKVTQFWMYGGKNQVLSRQHSEIQVDNIRPSAVSYCRTRERVQICGLRLTSVMCNILIFSLATTRPRPQKLGTRAMPSLRGAGRLPPYLGRGDLYRGRCRLDG